MATCSFSCLANSMDRAPWWATVLGVVKSHTSLSDWARTHTDTQGLNYGVVKNSCHMIHQSHFWACMWRKWKHYLEEISALHIHCRFIHISQDMKITYVSIDKWMDKKVRNYWFTCMDLEGIILSEISHRERQIYMFSLTCGF